MKLKIFLLIFLLMIVPFASAELAYKVLLQENNDAVVVRGMNLVEVEDYQLSSAIIGEYLLVVGDGSSETEYIDGELIQRHQAPKSQLASSNTFNEATIVSLDDVTKDCTQINCHNELGIFKYGDGTRYVGEFKDGFPNGEGKCEFDNGDIYEGEWKMHSPDGKGVLTFASGRKYAAIWEQGTPKERLLDDYEYILYYKMLQFENTSVYNNIPYVLFQKERP
jgi:hypothetical protein